MVQTCVSQIRFRFCNLVLAILSSAVFPYLALGQTPNLRPIQELLPNQTIQGEMMGAEIHRFRFDLKANEFVQVRVEQEGVDVLLKLLNTNGDVLATMDSPNGKQGQEILSFVAEKSGNFVLEVSGVDTKVANGNYSIRREVSRAATTQDQRRVEVEHAFVEGMTASKVDNQSDKAIAKLEVALVGWQELGDAYLTELTTQQIKQAKVNKYSAILFGDLLIEFNKAVAALGEGQKLSTRSRADSIAARKRLNDALSMFRALNVKLKDKALVEKVSQSGEVYQQLLDSLNLIVFSSRKGEALSLNGIAQTHQNLIEWNEYIEYLKFALRAYQELLSDKTLSFNSPDGKKNLIALKSLEAGALNNIGGAIDRYLRRMEEALEYLAQASDRYHALYQETQGVEFRLQEALTLTNMGFVHTRESKGRAKAIELFTKSLEIYRSLPNERRNEAGNLMSIALQQSLNFEHQSALKNWEEALVICREIDDKKGQSDILYSMSLMYSALNNKPKLKETVEQNLAVLQSPDYLENWKKYSSTRGLGVFDEGYQALIESNRLNSIAFNYRMLEDHSNSLVFYEQALAVSRSGKELRDIRLSAAAVAYTFGKMKKWDKALEFYRQALEISRSGEIKEDVADDLTDLGWTLLEAGKAQEALKYQNEALSIFQSVGIDGKNVFSLKYSPLLTELARTHDALGNRRLAIFYGKRGVNVIQEERQRLQNLEAVSQKGFLERKEKHYRLLADWLIAEGRIAEAEQVITLFKKDEYFDSLRADQKLEAIKTQSLDKILLTDAERDAFNRYEEIASQLAALGKEHDALEKKSKNFEAGKFHEQTRLNQLGKELADARTIFNKFLEELDAKFRSLAANSGHPSQASYSRALLKRLNQPRTAIVSTIVGQDRLNLIVTTARAYRAHTVNIKAADLNKLVVEFRDAVKNPKADPRPAGKKLYDVLFTAGLRRDLANAKADLIVWSLDGTLRYAPMIALWDGKRYLIERYANSIITLASRNKLNKPLGQRANWTALGVGISQGGTITEFDGTELEFAALPAVKEELCGVVNDPKKKRFCAQFTNVPSGILNGRNLSDDEFTLQSLKFNFGKYPVVHIASHFRLNPGNETTSYLLLGGRNIEERKLTLAAARDELGRKFERVELLTLSACNTAMSGGDKGNGAEVESFGALAQNLGAKTVLATLWPVNDSSTRDVMIEFYREMKVNRQIGKAEALRKAQLLLLQGGYKSGEIPMWRRGLRISNVEGAQTTSFERDKKARYAHPYYWSPFVLMGNWR